MPNLTKLRTRLGHELWHRKECVEERDSCLHSGESLLRPLPEHPYQIQDRDDGKDELQRGKAIEPRHYRIEEIRHDSQPICRGLHRSTTLARASVTPVPEPPLIAEPEEMQKTLPASHDQSRVFSESTVASGTAAKSSLRAASTAFAMAAVSTETPCALMASVIVFVSAA